MLTANVRNYSEESTDEQDWLRGLGRMEALHFAPETVAGRNMTAEIARAYTPGRDLTGREALELAARYGPWQGYWAYYLRAAA